MPTPGKVIEAYHPPKIHWRINWSTALPEKVEILQKQILPGATQPTYTYRDPNGRQAITGIEDGLAGHSTLKAALKQGIQENTESIRALTKQSREIAKEIKTQTAQKARLQKALQKEIAAQKKPKPSATRVG